MREVLLNCPGKAEWRGAGAGSSLGAQPHSCRILSSSSTRLSPFHRGHRSGSAHLTPPCSCIHFLRQFRDFRGASGACRPVLARSIVLVVSGTTYWHCSVAGTTWHHSEMCLVPPRLGFQASSTQWKQAWLLSHFTDRT